MENQDQNEGQNQSVYKQVSRRIDTWLEIHKGETFDLDLLCRQLEIASADGRIAAAKKLSYEVTRGILDKKNRYYRYIVRDKEVIDWLNASDEPILDISWPYGFEDNTKFGFDGSIRISRGDVIVVAGVTNTGKTTFCLNFLWRNMDKFHCVLMGNEYNGANFKFKANILSNWINPKDKDGKPKFELISRHSSWQDIIDPNGINIIDWLNIPDNFFQIGSVIEEIKTKHPNGISLIAIQKDPLKIAGMGGMFSMHLPSLYIAMDFERMTVLKAKAYNGHNPNGEIYGFKITNSGTMFDDIHKIKPCSKCKGFKGKVCTLCDGSGYVRADNGDSNGK
jgi:hypothetical protein